MAIKISDLSVGDWVRWMGKPCKVDVPLLFTEYYGLDEVSEDVSPIPITPEILEANGFEPPRVGIGFDTWFWSNRRDMALELRRYVNDKWQLAYQIKDKVQAHLLFPLYHIHELQHIIRLLHIDKEIVISKK